MQRNHDIDSTAPMSNDLSDELRAGASAAHVERAAELVLLAELHAESGRLGQARQAAEHAWALVSDFQRGSLEGARMRVKVLAALAVVCRAEGHHAEAAALYEKALEENTAAFGADDLQGAWLLNGFGAACEAAGWLSLGAQAYKAAAQVLERRVGGRTKRTSRRWAVEGTEAPASAERGPAWRRVA